jgi:hypothetical protein
MISRSPQAYWVLRVALALSTQVLPGQPYYAVSILGDTLSGRMTVWRIDENGAMTLHQNISLPSGSEAVHVDPFGRYVLFATEEGFQNYRIELWQVESDYTLFHTDSFSMEGMGFSPAVGEISQDGNWFVDLVTTFPPLTQDLSIQSFRLTEELKIELGGAPQSIASSELIHTIDLVVAQADASVVIVASNSDPDVIVGMSMDSSGAVERDGVTLELPVGGAQSMAVRLDGRIVVSGAMPLTLQVSSSGEIGHVDTADVPVQLRNAHFHPSRLGLVGGDTMNIVDLNRDGTFPNTYDSLFTSGFRGAAVTHDGRFVVYSQDCPGPGECFSVFRPHLSPASLDPAFTLVPLR